MSVPPTSSDRLEAATERERRRVRDAGTAAGLARRLDGPIGDRLSASLSALRSAYRRLRAKVGLPV